MDANRIDWLNTQYVWSIQNDGAWHNKAKVEVDSWNYGKFRRITGNFINNIEGLLGEKLEGGEWAFVLLELWVAMGGDKMRCLSSPGTLVAEYQKLLGMNHSGINTPAEVPMIRRKGDLYAVYGDVYTHKSGSTARQGRTYTEEEIAYIERAYRKGNPFGPVAVYLSRTALGVVEKMRLLGLIEKNSAGDYICAQDVPQQPGQDSPRNPCSEILLEVAAHPEQAAGHLDRVAEQLEIINKEKSIMQTNPNTAFETKTIIFGQDSASMSEQQLIDAIKRVEGEIAKLKEVKTTSKKIAANIAELQGQLDAIVAVLDAR